MDNFEDIIENNEIIMESLVNDMVEEGFFSNLKDKITHKEAEQQYAEKRKLYKDVQKRMEAFMNECKQKSIEFAKAVGKCEITDPYPMDAEGGFLKAPFIYGYQSDICFYDKVKTSAIKKRIPTLTKQCSALLIKHKLTQRDLPEGTTLDFSIMPDAGDVISTSALAVAANPDDCVARTQAAEYSAIDYHMKCKLK